MTGGHKVTTRLWIVPPAIPGEVRRLVLWTRILTGMELDPYDATRVLDAQSWGRYREELERLGGPP
jgi:hypothetical protein